MKQSNKTIKTILFLSICIHINLLNAQQIDTVYQAGSSFNDTFRSFHRDNQGNMYVLMEPSKETTNFFGLTVTKPDEFNSTVQNIFGKLDSNMNVQWVKQYDYFSSINSYFELIAIDAQSNVYLTDFDNRKTYKYSPDGNLIWTIPFAAYQISINEDGNIDLIRYKGETNTLNGEYISNGSGTVLTIDTEGNYVNHFMIDEPEFDEYIVGKNESGYYGYRRAEENEYYLYQYELILVNSNGNILNTKPLNLTSSTFQTKIVYDPVYKYYYAMAYYRDGYPINDLDPIVNHKRNYHIVQFDQNFNLVRTLKMSDDNIGIVSYPNFASIKTFNGDLYFGGTILDPKKLSHLGPLTPLNGLEDQIVVAKIDHTLNPKWYHVLSSTYFINYLPGIIPTDDGIFFGGKTDQISYGENTFEADGPTDVFIFKVSDNDSTSAYITGKVFADYNQNGIDDDEPGIKHQKIINNQISVSHYSDEDGFFKTSAVNGENILNSLSVPKYWARSTPDNFNITVSTNDTTLSGYKFGMYPIPGINDVEVLLQELTPARPGFKVSYKIKYRNIANDTLSGEITLAQDGSLNFLNASATPNHITEDSIFWNYDGLLPGEEREIVVNDSLNADVNLLSNFLVNFVSITPETTDINLENNRDTVIHQVTGSYDPNDISVTPQCIKSEEFITNEKYLEYLIRFQNTGTDTAFNVIVRDTIDDLLNTSTIEIIDASHTSKISLDNNVLTIFFEDILLPDSIVDFTGSNGFIKYKIRPITTLEAGSIIPNKAAIFFDFNPPIITNTTYTNYLTAPSPPDTIKVETCDLYTSSDNNTVWTESGLYQDTLLFYQGCDSIVVIDLTILQSSYSNLTASDCEVYTSPSGKYNWTETGLYTDTIPNIAGCDSIIDINLTIFHPVVFNQTISNCDSVELNGNTYFESQTVTDLFSGGSVNGCDSTVVTEVIINKTESSIDLEACKTLTSPSGNYIWTESGIYSDTILNTVGCDSILTINLTINKVETSVTHSDITLIANLSDANYQWLDCENNLAILPGETSQQFIATKNGKYAVEISTDACKDTSACYSILTVDILDDNSDKSFSIFPNPTHGILNLNLDQLYNDIRITVMNSIGQIVSVQTYKSTQNFSFEIKEYPGLYFIEIQIDNSKSYKLKVLKL